MFFTQKHKDTLGRIDRRTEATNRGILAILREQIKLKGAIKKIMGDQAQLDTDVATLVAQSQAQSDKLDTIKAAVDALKAANPSLDLSGLEAAITGDAAVTAKADEVLADATGNSEPAV